MDILNGKHIVLGVTGSIAAYKAAFLVRLLIKRGAEVQVVMTPAGKEFITPLTLSTLTRKPVVSEFFDRRDGSWNSHVDLGQWADAMLIAPCTAATLGKMASGVADNMLITTYFSKQSQLSKKKVLITAGPTYEAIDPVRFIGNYSTGKMGFALAEECAARGADVTLIAGPVNLKTVNPGINRIDVTSAKQMYEAAMEHFSGSDAAILCAAVADFTPAQTSDTKIKRKGEITLTLKPNPDIAASLGAIKRPDQRMVGFALETNDEFSNAQDKLERKNLDFIVLNSLRDEGAGFGYDTNKVTLIDRNGSDELPLQSKKDVAKAIITKLAGLLFCLAFLFMPFAAQAQELNPTLAINTSKIQGTDKDVFSSLESAVKQLLTNQTWTDYHFTEKERIQCNFNLVINKYDSQTGKMECELTVQSSRPVYGSTYNTTVFNFRDAEVDFTYNEQDRIEYTPGITPDNNLTAILAYYSLLIIGLDFDTMSPNGGTDILRQAENIAASSQSLGGGWRSFDSKANRYSIINDYMNGTLSSFRKLQYDYHRKGLDDMSANADRGRATITESLNLLSEAYQAKSTSALPTLFTEIKKNELINIYSSGISSERSKVVELLIRINPSLSNDWTTIMTQ